ncbi:hypothetical protein FPV67DRAFT_1558884 [Lyophyllum atratum]|nr:hypothetical protein FPV67DRAFT_1558884 [Lyophyllum atratum]
MTVRFGNYRIGFYVAVFLLSATVLGLAASFAHLFLPRLHHDFTIFSLIVPSLTLLLFLITLQWSQPRTEAVMLFIIGVLWLAMGAWSTDIIGNVQCDGLVGQRTATINGDTSAQGYCYEMKVIQAFSWMLFILNTIALLVLFRLANQAQMFGRYEIWREPIRGECLFGSYGQQPMSAPAMHPGQTVVIQPGMNGQSATVTHVPMA